MKEHRRNKFHEVATAHLEAEKKNSAAPKSERKRGAEAQAKRVERRGGRRAAGVAPWRGPKVPRLTPCPQSGRGSPRCNGKLRHSESKANPPAPPPPLLSHFPEPCRGSQRKLVANATEGHPRKAGELCGAARARLRRASTNYRRRKRLMREQQQRKRVPTSSAWETFEGEWKAPTNKKGQIAPHGQNET